jgi:threonine aldolase
MILLLIMKISLMQRENSFLGKFILLQSGPYENLSPFYFPRTQKLGKSSWVKWQIENSIDIQEEILVISRPMGKIIDLRSDTVTRPTPEMREAMKNAVVGDDILRDDPTVIELEEMATEIFGKEAALFTVSGTMSNEIAVMVYTKPGDEIVVFSDSHIYNLETGGLSAISGVQPRPVKTEIGTYDPELLEQAIMPQGVQRARTRLICLENSFHLDRGLAVRKEDYKETIRIAKEKGIPLFMDGARIFNSAVALHTNVKELAGFCDSVDVCLSKGLAAPIGSMLMGSKDFIEEARRVKQRLGGGMRQAGVIAAPGIIAFTKMVSRLHEDHENAERMRLGLEGLGIKVDRGGILTNIINLDISPVGWEASSFAEKLSRFKIKVKVCSKSSLRMVTHNDIHPEDVDFVLQTIKRIIQGLK